MTSVREYSPFILLVEDDPTVREVMRELLAMEGHQLLEAANGKLALQLLAGLALPPFMVLLDLMMPVMGGVEFLHELRKVDEPLSERVVLISASHDVARVARAERVAYLLKPFERNRLLEAVNRFCGVRPTEP